LAVLFRHKIAAISWITDAESLFREPRGLPSGLPLSPGRLTLGNQWRWGLADRVFANWSFADGVFADRVFANRPRLHDGLRMREVRSDGCAHQS